MFNESKEEFRTWLVKHNNISVKAAGDIVCRCNRLDHEVLESIDLSVSSTALYADALKQIKVYAIANKVDSKSQYNLTRSYRAALKKYCQYVNPETYVQYPTGYSIR